VVYSPAKFRRLGNVTNIKKLFSQKTNYLPTASSMRLLTFTATALY